MSKVTLTPLNSFTNDSSAVVTVNANETVIQTAFDNTLSRDGTSPNSMSAPLDMNGNNIVNLPSPGTLDSPVRLRDVATNPTITIPPSGTSGHVVPYLDGNNTFSGTNTFSGAVTATSTVNLTGSTVTVPTQLTADNSTNAASTAYVKANLPAFSTVAGLSVLGNAGTATTAPTAITGTANKFLGVNSAGTSLAFETMSGDATLASGALTLATVNANVGSFGDATHIPTVTVNAKGLVTAASQTALTLAGSALTGTSLASGIVTTSLTTTSNAVNLGAASATPASATLGGQNVATGTTNTPGADLNIAGGKSTGTGVGGKIKLQTTPAGSTGTAQNALTTRLTVDGPGNVAVGGSALATNATDGFFYMPSCAGPPTGTPTSYGSSCPLIYDSTNNKIYVYNSTSNAWKSSVALT